MEQKNLDLAKYKLCVLQFSWVQMTSTGYWLFGNEGLEKGHCDVLDFFFFHFDTKHLILLGEIHFWEIGVKTCRNHRQQEYIGQVL